MVKEFAEMLRFVLPKTYAKIPSTIIWSHTVTVTQNNEGAGGHPDLEANGVAAAELEAYIKAKGLI